MWVLGIPYLLILFVILLPLSDVNVNLAHVNEYDDDGISLGDIPGTKLSVNSY